MANPVVNPGGVPPQGIPPQQPQGGPPPINTGHGLPVVVWEHIRLFFGRIVRSNFLSKGVSDAEAEQLEAAGITHTLSQNYLAWRRALLWFGSVTLGLALLLGLFTRFEGISDVHWLAGTVFVLMFIAEIAACVVGILASLKWTNIVRTKQFARISFFCMFLLPLVLFLIPIAPMLPAPRPNYFGQQQQQDPRVLMALMGFILLIPKVIGLFPAVIRSSLSLKSLLPESTMPGWIAVLIAPFYALFFVLLLVIGMQTGEPLLILCLGGLAAAPIMIVTSVNKLVQPCNEEQALQTVRGVRKKITIANLIGVGAGIIYAFTLIKQISLVTSIGFVFSILATVFLLTVVTSDMLIGVFKTAFLKENALRERGLADDLAARFSDMDELGLTTISAGEGKLFKAVKDKVAGGGDEGQGGGGTTPPPANPNPPPAE